jgi:hypothetical protein
VKASPLYKAFKMDLKKAKEVAAPHLERSNILVVTSNHGVFNLDNESEIENVKEYAKVNNLTYFIVKGSKEVAEVVVEEAKQKKKK